MLERSPEDLAVFLTQDQKGQKIPSYLATLGKAISAEQNQLSAEAETGVMQIIPDQLNFLVPFLSFG